MHIKPVIAGVLGLSLAACAQQQVPPQAIGYNKAIGTARNSEILLNVVRAAHFEPMYFTNVGSIKFSDAVNAKLDLKMPLVGTNFGEYTITPTGNFNSGMGTFQVSQLQKEEFIKLLHSPIKDKDISFYLNAGWNPELIFNLIIKRIRINQSKLNGLVNLSEESCKTNHENKYCKAIETSTSDYQRLLSEKKCHHAKPLGQNSIILFENHGSNPCKFLPFQTLIRMFLTLNIQFQAGNSATNIVLFSQDGAQLMVANLEKENSSVASQFSEGITRRSLQGVLFYLGEAARNSLRRPGKPQVFIAGEFEELDIMRVRKAAKAPLDSSFHVRKNLADFYIPVGRGHTSGSSLIFSKQLLEFAITKDVLPDPDLSVSIETTK